MASPGDHIGSFPADVSITSVSDDVELSLEVTAQSSKASMQELARIVDAFVIAINAGMFSENPARPSSMQVVSVPEPSQGAIRYRLKGRGIQPGAYRILLNMLAQLHFSSMPLASVRLTSASKSGRRLNGSAVMEEAFPTTTASVPFDLRLEYELTDFKQPTIRLEFERDVTDEQMQKLVPAFVAWDDLVGLGGYLEDFDERDLENSVWSQETHMAAPDTVEHAFYGIVGAEAAFDALINMAIHLHYTFCPLIAFEVE